MKDRFIKLVFLFIFYSCTSIKYNDMAINEPLKLIAMKDSLNNSNPKLDRALVVAYNNIGLEAIKNTDYEKANNAFLNSQKICKTDSLSKYSLLMIRGHKKINTGKKELLWEAIQDYYKASSIYPLKGEPFYYIGETYLKLGDKDFDLIIESYEKALLLELDPEFRLIVLNSKEEASRRKALLKNFWK